METLVTVIVLGPLLGAIVAGLVGRRIGDVASMSVTTGLLLVSMVLSWYVFLQWQGGALQGFTRHIAPFITVGKFQSDWAIRVDALSVVMLVVVNTVSALVHVYSWGY